MSANQDLHAAYSAGEVCLFVGAGVSMGCGLPDWEGLAKKVIENFPKKPGPALGARAAAVQAGTPAPPDPNALAIEKAKVLADQQPLLSMRYARCDQDVDLKTLVSKCLYSKRPELSETVREIVNLDNVHRICCFNYDDILDRAFANAHKPYLALFPKDRVPLEAPETLIFYPHGFLPAPDIHSYPPTDNIVLSEDDYFDLYRSPYAWANLIQLMLLLNYKVLFIGCSLLDPNLRRLLDIAAKMRLGHRHYAFFRDPYSRPNAMWYEVSYATAYRAVQMHLLDGLSVVPIWVSEYSDIAEMLRNLRSGGLH